MMFNNDIKDSFYLNKSSNKSQASHKKNSYMYSFNPATNETITTKMFYDFDSDEFNFNENHHSDPMVNKKTDYKYSCQAIKDINEYEIMLVKSQNSNDDISINNVSYKEKNIDTQSHFIHLSVTLDSSSTTDDTTLCNSFYGYNGHPLPEKYKHLCWSYDEDIKLVKLLETHGQQ